MDAPECEAWADHQTQHIWRDMRTDSGKPLTAEEVACAMRAAYAQGYMDALSEAEPVTIREAMSRSAILDTLVPVV